VPVKAQSDSAPVQPQRESHADFVVGSVRVVRTNPGFCELTNGAGERPGLRQPLVRGALSEELVIPSRRNASGVADHDDTLPDLLSGRDDAAP
jgi:hypothetical protein